MPRALIATIAVALGIAGAAVAYPAAAKPGSGHRTQKLATALKKCEQDKSKRRRKKCEKTAKAEHKSKTQTRRHGGTGTGTGISTGTSTGTGTTGTTGTPEAVSATIIVHVDESYALACTPEQAANHQCEPSPDEGAQLRISRLGATNEVASSIETSQHTVRVAPGHYEVALTVDTAYKPQQVTVTAGQTQEVTIEIQRK